MAHPDTDSPPPPAAQAPGFGTSQDATFLDAADKIRALEAERDEFRDRWMRAEAEMQNLRSRTKREVDETRQYAVQKFARDVVEAAENLRRGIDTLPKTEPGEPDIVTKVREGFEGVERSFIGLLERNGITPEEPLGKMFDANLHQAMAEQPSEEHPAGTVLQAWSRGWLLNGRLLRPAMVVVSKGPVAPPASVDTTA
jgi:molecular chaperone GrpE